MSWRDTIETMAGAIGLIIVMLLIPVIVLMTGALVSALVGETMRRDAIARFQGSELLDVPD